MSYNVASPGLVSTRAAAGKHVIFVDNYVAFVKDPSYTTTEMSRYLPPDTAGYAVLGDSFFAAISRLPALTSAQRLVRHIGPTASCRCREIDP